VTWLRKIRRTTIATPTIKENDMTFTTTQLTGDRVLVQGTDIFGTNNKTVVDGEQWAELNARTNLNKAQAAFDEAIEEFFAPLQAAADKIEKSLAKPTDASAYVVLDEGSEGVNPTPRHVVNLTHGSIVLRLIEEGQTDRLLWVGDELEVIAVTARAATNQVTGEPMMTEAPQV
jgi:acetylornithine deacetylase/succinyl-diaminopimelate desuccinylase-like protein